MPLPTPGSNESKDDFISRCMSDETMMHEYPGKEQRSAICYSKWEENMSNKMKVNTFRGTGYLIRDKGDLAEILIYDDIGDGWLGGISAQSFIKDLQEIKSSQLTVRINSQGGSLFEGNAIYNAIKRHPANVNVAIDGIALSIASIIAMAGDHISMAENAFMMIHDPWIVTAGTADELRDQADVMDKTRDSLINTYKKKTNMDAEEISAMMKVETWMNAQEALDMNFVDSITEEMQLAASLDKNRYRHIPDQLLSVNTPRLDILRDKIRINRLKLNYS